MTSPHVSALKNMALLRTLSAAEFDAIAAIVESRTIPAGKELFREGDAGDGLYLLVSGEINVVKQGTDGEHLLAKLESGAVLGEMSLITSDARSATGRAVGDAIVLRLPADGFRALIASGSTAALKMSCAIAEVLARRLAAMNSIVLALSGKPATPTGSKGAMKTQDLRELHRTMQVWSF